jgi:hypothetical protein
VRESERERGREREKKEKAERLSSNFVEKLRLATADFSIN